MLWYLVEKVWLPRRTLGCDQTASIVERWCINLVSGIKFGTEHSLQARLRTWLQTGMKPAILGYIEDMVNRMDATYRNCVEI